MPRRKRFSQLAKLGAGGRCPQNAERDMHRTLERNGKNVSMPRCPGNQSVCGTRLRSKCATRISQWSCRGRHLPCYVGPWPSSLSTMLFLDTCVSQTLPSIGTILRSDVLGFRTTRPRAGSIEGGWHLFQPMGDEVRGIPKFRMWRLVSRRLVQ